MTDLTREDVFNLSVSAEDRLSSRFSFNENGCMIFTGALDRCGYGKMPVGKRRLGAHRVSFALTYGSVSGEDVVMHSCDNPSCINPSHLSAGTQSENIQQSSHKGRLPINGIFKEHGHRERTVRGRVMIGEKDGELVAFHRSDCMLELGFNRGCALRACRKGVKYRGFVWRLE